MIPARKISEYAEAALGGAIQRAPASPIVDQYGRERDWRAEERLAYEGARRGRRTDGWVTASTSATSELAAGLSLLRDRSRDLIRNNPHAAKALRVFRSHAVGTGINPKVSGNRDLLSLWYEHGAVIDADGHSDVQGIISLAAGTTFESGAVLIRRRPRRSSDGLPLPFQVQVLEPDFLDVAKNETLRNGGRIVRGIEFDAIGRRAAYWLFPEHPGDSGVVGLGVRSLQSRRVPARDVIHSFERWRPGQIEGVPWLAASMLALRQTDDWIDADLMRKTVEACIVGFVKRPQALGHAGFGPRETTGDEPPVETFEPGTFAYGRPGEDVEFNDPKGVTDHKFLDERLHAISAGAGIPYEEMTGNLSQTNFSSYRAGRLSFWAMISEYQALTLIPHVCRGIWRWFIEDAELLRRREVRGETHAEWVPPRFPTVNAQQDRMGELLALRMGGMSWPQFVTEQGFDPDEQLEEIREWNKKLDLARVVVEGDPRKVARSGSVQNQPLGGEE